MKRLSTIITIILITGFFLEISLRYIWGFCSAPLYIESREFEYIYAPNQHLKRFGNSIITNQYSMRSKPLTEGDSIRVLLIGDSVINGGAPTDQDSLASTILEDCLSKSFKKPVRVLNISAGSWGPDNAAAYIKKFGHFDAKAIILVFSSHDAYDNMSFEKVVGVHPSYPKQQANLAISELMGRYIIPKILQSSAKIIHKNQKSSEINELLINKQRSSFNSGFKFFSSYSQENQIPLILYLHPELFEISKAAYTENGKKIIEFSKNESIHLINGLSENTDKAFYRDNIHLNNKGQKHLAKCLFPIIVNILQKKVN